MFIVNLFEINSITYDSYSGSDEAIFEDSFISTALYTIESVSKINDLKTQQSLFSTVERLSAVILASPQTAGPPETGSAVIWTGNAGHSCVLFITPVLSPTSQQSVAQPHIFTL